MGDDYISVSLSFIAVLIGIFGDTWNAKKKGLKKLRLTGWVAIVLGLATLIYNCNQIYGKHLESNMRKEAAISRLNEPVRHLLLPLENLLLAVNKRYNGKNAYLIMGDHQKDTFVHYLKYKPFLEDVGKIKVKEKPFKKDTLISWEDHFKKHTAEAGRLLNDVLSGSSADLDTETILAINAVLNDNVFKAIPLFRQARREEHSTALAGPFEESNITDILKMYYPTNWYNNYLNHIKKLYDIVEKNKKRKDDT